MYNLFTCGGFDTGVMGGCSIAWLTMCLIFFINAFIRKWGGEEAGLDYNFWAGLGAGCLAYAVVISIFGSIFWSLLAGIAGVLVGGYGLGFLDSGDGSEG